MLPRAGRFAWPLDIGYVRPPYASFPAGAPPLVAGANGVILGRFGWAATDGTVSNLYAAGSFLGFVLPVYDAWNWQRAYPSFPAWQGKNQSGYPVDPIVNNNTFPVLVLRSGQQAVLGAIGDYVTPFQYGIQVGEQVFADPASGQAVDSTFAGGIATSFTAMQSGSAGSPVRISSSVKPFS